MLKGTASADFVIPLHELARSLRSHRTKEVASRSNVGYDCSFCWLAADLKRECEAFVREALPLSANAARTCSCNCAPCEHEAALARCCGLCVFTENAQLKQKPKVLGKGLGENPSSEGFPQAEVWRQSLQLRRRRNKNRRTEYPLTKNIRRTAHS